jgi:tetratricopeptide (TPR) repeat protein
LAKSDSMRAEVSMALAQIYTNIDYVRAGEYAERAVDYSKRTGNLFLMSACLTAAGEIYLNAGQNDIAIDFFHQNIKLAKEADNNVLQVKAASNLGLMWLVSGEYEKAEQLMKQMEESIDLLDTASMIGFYNNMIIVNNDKQDIDASRGYFDRGIALAGDKAELRHLRGQLYSNYGDVLVGAKRYDEAIALVDTAIMLFTALEDYARQGSCLYDLATIFRLQGKRQEAIANFRQAYEIGLITKNNHLIRISSQALYEEYQAESKVDSILKYLTIASESSVRIVELDTKAKLKSQELRWWFETQQEREKKLYQRRLLMGFFVGMVVIVFLLWRIRNRQQQMQLMQLEKKSLELNARNLQLENEILAAEVDQKDKQLTMEVMYRIQNNEMVRGIVGKLLKTNVQSGKDAKELIQSVVTGLEKMLEEKAWEDFELRFQQVHPGFYEKLQEAYPELSLNERRLCAFLKLNMTTKEISALTGQNISAIQMARWRMRKKLGLQESESALADFFSQF